jgi:hypothetical protein
MLILNDYPNFVYKQELENPEKIPLLINLRTHKKSATISATIFLKGTGFCSLVSPVDMGAILGAGNIKYLM